MGFQGLRTLAGLIQYCQVQHTEAVYSGTVGGNAAHTHPPTSAAMAPSFGAIPAPTPKRERQP